MTSSPLEAALAYRPHGLVVIPLQKGFKLPRDNAWQKEGPQTEARIRELFANHDGNIGIACGSVSCLVVLDIDRKKGKDGFASLASWEDKHGPLPRTYTTQTASGTEHRYFRLPPGRKVQTGKHLGPGIDVMGDTATGGAVQVVAPPSVLIGDRDPKGQVQTPGKYRVLVDAPIANAPPHLLAVLPEAKVIELSKPEDWEPIAKSDPTYAARVAYQRDALAKERLYLSGESTLGKGRYVLLFQRLGPGLLLDAETTFDNFAECYDPRLPADDRWLPDCEQELKETIGRAYTRPFGDGHKPNEEWTWTAQFWTPAVTVAPDTPPNVVERPVFPVHVLPPALRDFVTAQAEFTQVPVDLPAMLSLGACAAAIAGKVDLEVQPDYVEPLNLFILVGMETGERKSPNFDACFAPIQEAERMAAEASAPYIAQATAKREAKERLLRKRQSEYAGTKREDMDLERANNSRKPGGKTLEQEIGDLATELSKLVVPAVPKYIVDDCTIERLAGLMGEQGGRMCVASDEGSILKIAAGRYSKDGNASFEVLLKGYSGTEIRIDRQSKDRPPVFVRRPRLTMCLAVQPSIIRGLITDPSMRSQGLLARFLYALPSPMLGTRLTDTKSVPGGVRAAYEASVKRLLGLPVPDNEIPCVPLSPQALALHKAFRADLEPRLHPKTGDLIEIVDWATKFAGQVARIAGVLSVTEHGPGLAVSESTMERAVEIGDYLLAHALAAYDAMAETVAARDARALLDWAKRKGATVATMRQLRQFGPRPVRDDARRLKEAVQELFEIGQLEVSGDRLTFKA